MVGARQSEIPYILFSGNHTAIESWRKKESLRITKECRPDLFSEYKLTKSDLKLLKEIEENDNNPKWYQEAIENANKFMKK